jgi:nucleotide-binding universal stress UspA family protein
MSDRIRTIVAGVATVSPDDSALTESLGLAERLGAELHLVHVCQPDDEDVREYRRTHPDADAGDLYREGVRSRLEAQVQESAGARPRVRTVVVDGNAEEVIPRVAEEVGADLMILGASRRGGVATTFLGSTAQNVLRAARVPVVVLRRERYHPPMHRVLAATDLSGHSARALRLGLPIARELAGGGEVQARALFVTGPDYAAELVEGEFASAERALPKLEEFLRSTLPGEALEPRAAVGNAGREIVNHAGEWQADVVVLGTHGRKGVRRLFVGSVAETVLRGAPCSVLVIPPTAALPGEAAEAAD